MITTERGKTQIFGSVPEIFTDLENVVCGIKQGLEKHGMSPGFVDKRIEETIATAIRRASMTPEEMDEDVRRSIAKTVAEILKEIGG